MIKLISPYTGANTYITDDRLKEYLDAGYKLAVKAEPAKEEKPVKEEKPAKPKRRGSKK